MEFEDMIQNGLLAWTLLPYANEGVNRIQPDDAVVKKVGYHGMCIWVVTAVIMICSKYGFLEDDDFHYLFHLYFIPVVIWIFASFKKQELFILNVVIRRRSICEYILILIRIISTLPDITLSNAIVFLSLSVAIYIQSECIKLFPVEEEEEEGGKIKHGEDEKENASSRTRATDSNKSREL